MKLHRNLVFAIIDALNLIFNEGQYADKVVQKVLKFDKRWGSRDRGFIAETTYEMVRYKRLYAEIAEVKAPFSRPDLFRMWAVWAVLKGIKLPDWKQIEPTPERRIKGRFDELSKIRKFREAFPDWIDELCVEVLGEQLWTAESAALNQQAEVILRINTLKTNKKNLQKVLLEEDILTEPISSSGKASRKYPSALRLPERANVFVTDAFKKGMFEVQDANSQLVAPFLDVQPGMRVVDTCAGAGGKSLHLAALMENKGQIVAMDVYGSKLKELKRRARRNGAHNIETREIDSTKVFKKLYGSADRVLIDAPCTGLGVIRRNPDTKWKLQPEFLEKITKTQQEILRSYSKIVKPGGKLVYATCSILPQENYAQVQSFLTSEEGQGFSLEKEKKIFASKSGFDGFYMALLTKSN
ncbi:RsmB/NOP family class I SAM-dependent RNA methyltransferase [Pricia sp. S334]|uniref:RsmB/NOP family class I SAM-dependent RNA methyltransferase n=1 Tax=Pricia mediterranea TaxID=3076079 RepID=A0ABU3LAC6_9FLAO|nr:RsmB/NOP family class I SAM-dependent RNA methyltransferase [Pricia sp. S334]MDT7830251.1 RsmB/NOP family class I SAM-dependent RNA methyltransferase [Pricia sp. S334]